LRPPRWSLRGLLLALLVIVAVPASASASPRQDRTEAAILHAINKVRAQHHLSSLHTSTALARAADAHSASMLRSNTFGHGSVQARLRRYTHAKSYGETLAWQTTCDPSGFVNMWLNSAAHRAIMLSPKFRIVGIGRRSSPGKCMVTADFAG
jgi:uncharacterized protein YkwD